MNHWLRQRWVTRALLVLPGIVLAACAPEEATHMVGTLERDRVSLAVEHAEPVVEVLVEDGTAVTAGTLILRQDPTRFEARLARTRALRDQAAARLAELRRGPRPEDIEQARAELTALRAQLRNARANLEREQALFERGLGEAQARDERQSRVDDLLARERAQGQAVERLLNGATVEELDQAEAALAALEADVTLAKLDRSRLELRAPRDGWLDRTVVRVGERPAAGSTAAILLDAARPYARIYVPEPLRARIRPGATLVVAVDGVDEPLRGTVRWVSADASFTPYFALTEHDRSRLSYLAEVDLPGATMLPSGVPLDAWLP